MIFVPFRSESLHSLSLMFLAQTFYCCALRGTGNMECLQWFLELLGHTRNLATGIIKLADDVTDPPAVSQSLNFMLSSTFSFKKQELSHYEKL